MKEAKYTHTQNPTSLDLYKAQRHVSFVYDVSSLVVLRGVDKDGGVPGGISGPQVTIYFLTWVVILKVYLLCGNPLSCMYTYAINTFLHISYSINKVKQQYMLRYICN